MKILERTIVSPSTENLHRSEYPDHWERYEFASNFVDGKSVSEECLNSFIELHF
jgi:hypothetical protein